MVDDYWGRMMSATVCEFEESKLYEPYISLWNGVADPSVGSRAIREYLASVSEKQSLSMERRDLR